jgi:hypothetical protein
MTIRSNDFSVKWRSVRFVRLTLNSVLIKRYNEPELFHFGSVNGKFLVQSMAKNRPTLEKKTLETLEKQENTSYKL